MFTLWPISFWQGKCSPQSQSLALPGLVPPEFTRRCETRRAAVSSPDLHLSPLLKACSSPLELATPRGTSKPMREGSPRAHTPTAPLSCCSCETSRLLSGSHRVWTSVVRGGNLPFNWPSLDMSVFSHSHVFPRITFQINRLCPWPHLRVCLGCPELRQVPCKSVS